MKPAILYIILVLVIALCMALVFEMFGGVIR